MATHSSTVTWRIRQEEKGTKEDEMVGWHRQLNGPEFEKLWELVGCAGTGGLRGATPCSRSGGAAVRRYPLTKVRSSSCALLEQL